MLRMVVAYNGADAGLGNRVRVTLGAARFARWTGARLAYVWPSSHLFEPLLTDLWEWREGLRIPRAASRGLGLLTGYVGNDLTAAAPRRLLQIRTGGELVLPTEAGSWTEDLRALRPVHQIASAVTRMHEGQLTGRPYVGVQIRAHKVSHAKTKDTSPVSWFVTRMRQILEERPDTGFYLSCDVAELKRRLLEKFPTALAYTVDAPYNSTAAVRAAVVDLYLLASSSYMLGPDHSSFIETAQFLSGMTVPTEKPTEIHSKRDDWWSVPGATDPLRPAIRGLAV